MGIFEDVTLSFKGEEYTVSADKVMRLIATVEEHLSFNDLAAGPDKVKFTKIAFAYGAALRFAGARVMDDEIYNTLFGEEGANVHEMLNNLMLLMIPPAALQSEPPEKKETPNQSKAG